MSGEHGGTLRGSHRAGSAHGSSPDLTGPGGTSRTRDAATAGGEPPPVGPTLVVLAAGRAKRYGGPKPLAPVGLAGEAVVDLLASDALAAGFATIVIVVSPVTGPAIRYHVERTWPSVDVRFAVQDVPMGTAHAVVAAVEHLPAGRSFGVANADDLYGIDGLSLLAGHLHDRGHENVLVAYRLRHAVIGQGPVTRGLCHVDGDGLLRGLEERREVLPAGPGRFVAEDGRVPVEIDGDELVSMNLWGFSPEMLAVLRRATEDAVRGRRDGAGVQREVLLPDVVGDLVAGRRRPPGTQQAFRVLAAGGRCIGVTHPGDLDLVQADLAAQVGKGERPAAPWSDLKEKQVSR